MDDVKEEPAFEDGVHEITSPNELIVDMKYEEHQVPEIETDERVRLILGKLKIGSLL
jgi:hypothetical protein